MTGPPAATAAVRLAVRRSLADLPADAPVAAAVSGGADSLALAAALAVERPGSGALVVDHALQADSAQVAARAAEQCRALGLRAEVLGPGRAATPGCSCSSHGSERVESKNIGAGVAGAAGVAAGAGAGGPEAAARDLRYALLDEAAGRCGLAAVLLGHTRDDQAETVLLGLARGSGARALAGMPAVRGRYRRPLLALERATVRAACAQAGLVPHEDVHNGDAAFARVRVRHAALPALEQALGPGVAAALARTAGQLREDADALDALTPDLPAEADCAALAALPAALRARALKRWAEQRCGTAVTAAHVDALRALVERWRGQGAVALPGGLRVTRRDGGLRSVPGVGTAAAAASLAPVSAAVSPAAQVRVGDVPAEIERVLISEEQISTRVAELAAAVDEQYAGREVLLVGVLKGAVMFMADIARAMRTPVSLEFMAVSSYGSATSSSGVVRILKDLDRDIVGKHVLVVEDIIDSGLTLSWLVRNLRTRGPASVGVVALLRKPEAVQVEVQVDHVGFEIPSEFVVGYGLDYAERYRDLPFVGLLRPEAIAAGEG